MKSPICCSFKDHELVSQKYPKRKVYPEPLHESGSFTVLRKNLMGTFVVKLKDWSVWVPWKYPYFKRRK